MTILFLCNNDKACKGIMAEAFLKNLDKTLIVISAGNYIPDELNPIAIIVMSEIGIDISELKPRNAEDFKERIVDYLITICDGTHEKISLDKYVFKKRIHLGLDLTFKKDTNNVDYINVFRALRDELSNEISYFYHHIITPEISTQN